MTKLHNCKPCEDKTECLGKCVEHAVIDCKKKCCSAKYERLARKLIEGNWFVEKHEYIREMRAIAILGPKYSAETSFLVLASSGVLPQNVNLQPSDFYSFSWPTLPSWRNYSPLAVDSIWCFAMPIPSNPVAPGANISNINATLPSFRSADLEILQMDAYPLVFGFNLENATISTIGDIIVAQSTNQQVNVNPLKHRIYRYTNSLALAMQSVIDQSTVNILTAAAGAYGQSTFNTVEYFIDSPIDENVKVKQKADVGFILVPVSNSASFNNQNQVILMFGVSTTLEVIPFDRCEPKICD